MGLFQAEAHPISMCVPGDAVRGDRDEDVAGGDLRVVDACAFAGFHELTAPVLSAVGAVHIPPLGFEESMIEVYLSIAASPITWVSASTRALNGAGEKHLSRHRHGSFHESKWLALPIGNEEGLVLDPYPRGQSWWKCCRGP